MEIHTLPSGTWVDWGKRRQVPVLTLLLPSEPWHYFVKGASKEARQERTNRLTCCLGGIKEAQTLF